MSCDSSCNTESEKATLKVSYGYCSCSRKEFQLNVPPCDGEAVHRRLLNPFMPHVVYYDVIKAFKNRCGDLYR